MLGALRELPVSVLLTSFAIAVAALPVQTAALQPPLIADNFKTAIAKGVWFVEHYSPYCGHCKAFAPTWEKLAEESENYPGVELAQVDCSVSGDLCDANGITGYPQIHLYRDGEFVEKYKGNRDLNLLVDYIAKYSTVPEPEPPTVSLNLNPTGTVTVLDGTNFQSTVDNGPAFIKFYAPWCGHCKKLAPIWKQLAKHMQSKVSIAEVNCDENAALCKSQGVGGYPTLIYYPYGGAKSEYTMGRKLDQLKAFVDKASASATQAIKADELDAYVDENPVVYLLLHLAGDHALVKTVGRLAAPLLGSPVIYTSPSKTLYQRYEIPDSSLWAVVVLKDHDSKTPAAIYHGTDSFDTSGGFSPWLLENRLPTSMELTQDTFQSVMNAPHAPLVVIAAVNKENKDKVAERFRDIALKWRVRTSGSGKFAGKSVVFTWMDVERWESWMKSMYGLTKGGKDSIEDVGVVIANHQELKYYDTEQSNVPIKLTSPSIFSALEGAANGTTKAKDSENFVERMARYLNAKVTATEAYVWEHPFYSICMMGMIFAVFYLGLRRCFSDDSNGDRDYGPDKSGRMD